jgi:hypothetical protein
MSIKRRSGPAPAGWSPGAGSARRCRASADQRGVPSSCSCLTPRRCDEGHWVSPSACRLGPNARACMRQELRARTTQPWHLVTWPRPCLAVRGWPFPPRPPTPRGRGRCRVCWGAKRTRLVAGGRPSPTPLDITAFAIFESLGGRTQASHDAGRLMRRARTRREVSRGAGLRRRVLFVLPLVLLVLPAPARPPAECPWERPGSLHLQGGPDHSVEVAPMRRSLAPAHSGARSAPVARLGNGRSPPAVPRIRTPLEAEVQAKEAIQPSWLGPEPTPQLAVETVKNL